jgi:hypothetical protein
MTKQKQFRIKKWVVLTAVVLFGAASWFIGFFLLGGENPIKMAPTLWYFQQTEREALRIAADERHVTYQSGELATVIGDYIPRISNQYMGQWELISNHDSTFEYRQESNRGTRILLISYQPYLDEYVIFQIDSERTE